MTDTIQSIHRERLEMLLEMYDEFPELFRDIAASIQRSQAHIDPDAPANVMQTIIGSLTMLGISEVCQVAKMRREL